MTGLIGADVEALTRLADDFAQGAEELRELSQQLARGIDAAHEWQGADAVRCKQEWGEFAQTQMSGVAGALEVAGRALRENAAEQDRASAATGSGSAAGSPGYGVWAGLSDAWHLKGWLSPLVTAGTKAWGLAKFIGLVVRENVAAVVASEKLIAALRTFMVGSESGGALGALGLPVLGRLLGKAFLPLTVLSGLGDVVTGGGYDGWRAAATRGFAAAGVLGAGALIVGGVALAPVTAAVAAGAVTLYATWSAVNLAYDHREQIRGAIDRLGSAVGLGNVATSTVDHVTHGFEAAKGWARGLLAGLTPRPAGA